MGAMLYLPSNAKARHRSHGAK